MEPRDKKIKVIKELLNSAYLPNREFARRIEVKAKPNIKDVQYYSVEVEFRSDIMDRIVRENFLNNLWQIIYDFVGEPVFVKDITKSKKINENENKELKLLYKFLSSISIEGVCGFWIDEEKDENDMHWVYLIVDKNWLDEYPTKPEFVVRRIRNGVKEEIKKFLGIDVKVGSILKECD